MKNKFIRWIAIFTFTLPFSMLGQDGKQLFKSRCNVCHMEDKNGTGPKLMGVKAKWEAAKEGEMLYKWVENSAGLIASGKSKLALQIKGYSPTEMPNQTVTKGELDAIFTYIDSYSPAIAVNPSSINSTKKVVKIVPNYSSNLEVFYGFLVLGIVLIIAILILSASIISLIKSDFFKEKLAKGSNLLPIIILIISFGLMGSNSQLYGLNFMSFGEATEKMPWLLVEKIDLYFLLAIDLILFGVLLYLKTIFNRFMAMILPEKEVRVPKKALKKLNAILTDTVPIELEHKILMDHEYDGIRELDNNLPPWWTWGFIATIVFAVIYLFNYHVIGYSDLQIKAYEKEVVQANSEIKAYLSQNAMNVDETNVKLLTEPDAVAKGKGIFNTNCILCHKKSGEGDVGPNLTDKAWVYGFDIKDIFSSIKNGRPNGMPEHASKLNPVEIQQVSSYVVQLPFIQGTKPAQGDKIEK